MLYEVITVAQKPTRAIQNAGMVGGNPFSEVFRRGVADFHSGRGGTDRDGGQCAVVCVRPPDQTLCDRGTL